LGQQLEKVVRLRIKKDPSSLYVLRGDTVYRIRRGSPLPPPEEIATFEMPAEPGWVYCLDKDGDVARSRSVDRTPRPTPSKPAKPHKSFAKLAKFSAVVASAADERFHVDEVHPDWDLPSLFGKRPDTIFIHEGSVEVEGNLSVAVTGAYAGVYVIDGDLLVSGLFEYAQIDGASVLYVTGSVRTRDLALASEAQLWIGKKLTVDDHIVEDMTDAGSLFVKGATKATRIVACGRSSSLAFAKKPSVKVARRPSADYAAFVRALAKGKTPPR
jgi:hypothetical protein